MAEEPQAPNPMEPPGPTPDKLALDAPNIPEHGKPDDPFGAKGFNKLVEPAKPDAAPKPATPLEQRREAAKERFEEHREENRERFEVRRQHGLDEFQSRQHHGIPPHPAAFNTPGAAVAGVHPQGQPPQQLQRPQMAGTEQQQILQTLGRIEFQNEMILAALERGGRF